jgi:hypothetical protein
MHLARTCLQNRSLRQAASLQFNMETRGSSDIEQAKSLCHKRHLANVTYRERLQIRAGVGNVMGQKIWLPDNASG